MKIYMINICTKYFKEEIKFYQDIGFTIDDNERINENVVLLKDNEGEFYITVSNKNGAENSGNQFLTINYKTEDLEKMRETLAEKRYTIIEPDQHLVPSFKVIDPAGVQIMFT